MKKGLVLATILTLCSTTMVIAKEFNDARWQWFYSNANYTGKVDLNTLSYDPATDTATAWAVWLRTTGFQQLQSYTILLSMYGNFIITEQALMRYYVMTMWM